jgi:hypothetical protein
VGGMDDVVVARVAEDAVLPVSDLEGECGLWTTWVAGCWGQSEVRTRISAAV